MYPFDESNAIIEDRNETQNWEDQKVQKNQKDRDGRVGQDAPKGRILKVLQVTPDLRLGGLQRVVIDLACGLRNLGHEAHICSLRGPGPLLDELRGREIPSFSMPWPERGADRLMFLKMYRLLRDGKYDVVHTHNTQAFMDAGLAAILAGSKVRVHTDHARPFPDRKVYMRAERLLSLGYDKVIGVSVHTAENLRRFEKISSGKLEVILNGIDGASYRARNTDPERTDARRALGLEECGPIFGLGVRLEEQKGIRYLLEAMPKVLSRHPKSCLLIAGSGSQEPPLRELAGNLDVGDRVRFLGALPDLKNFYPLLDFFLLPSLWEGLPLCLLEAMSLGLPIIASRVGGVAELLTHNREAILVDPAAPTQIAAALMDLQANPDKARSLGEAARKLFDSRFDASVMVENYLRLYRSCL